LESKYVSVPDWTFSSLSSGLSGCLDFSRPTPFANLPTSANDAFALIPISAFVLNGYGPSMANHTYLDGFRCIPFRKTACKAIAQSMLTLLVHLFVCLFVCLVGWLVGCFFM
jgi:hypothetical protein